MENKKKIPSWLKISILLIFVVGGYFGWTAYKTFLASNVTDNQKYLYINTGDTYAQVLQKIKEQKIVSDPTSFDRAAKYQNYTDNVKPGRYALTPGMNNRRFIGNLRGGYQEPVKFRFENIRLKENFAAKLADNFEADSVTFLKLLNNEDLAKSYGFTKDNFIAMFIPNTYELYWNTTPEKLFARFHDEWEKFWTPERLAKAKAINLTPQQVSSLAAIVKGEALHKDEMPAIAGLYLNRLQKGMLLQADPTVIFANNDFTIRRVLNKHLRVDNPYNTYVYKGLPPGPIMMPSIVAIDAVLNYKHHDYIYMCAKEDFSGYHAFATNVAEHQINARKFQKALDERNIKK
ncbi:endolytic transglycosylase MltG [Sphingobacterium faecium]|uniref:endolytic transglycosylase MltG n=1 Tax=Sphingobacterium faecium TaxID=34087 RepID=UPI00097EA39D|nr:endolytic transglycosylase MltG [Sphingobacterium faecium]WGQ16052.1 endolytic transglycosylase MltG [Sphingobacterium faecium]SJN50563.1 protein YceG like [Sphingobacterium faecium PCAi_F2.5]